MKRTIAYLLSLFAAAGLSLQLEDSGYIFHNSRSFLWVPLFLVFVFMLKRILEDPDKRLKRIVTAPAFIMALCDFMGSVLVKKGTALWILTSNHGVGKLLFFAGRSVLYYCLIFFICKWFTAEKNDFSGFSKTHLFPLLWILLIIAWIPWLLGQFPAVMTADTTDQIEMALGAEPLTNHHPVFYTLIIRGALAAGRLLAPEDPNQTGIILFTLVQFLLMSGAAAFVLQLILTSKTYRFIKTGAFLFLLFYPVHPLYSVTMWKDVPFAAALLMFEAMLILEQTRHNRFTCICIALFGLLMSLFRHNGIYILLLCLPFLRSGYKHNRRPVLISFLVPILLFLVWTHLLLPAFSIPAGEASEAFSIPLQQIALTAKRQKANLTAEQKEEILSWFGGFDVAEAYTYRISDPVKNHFDEKRYQADPSAFWKFWWNLGTRFPQDYLDGILLHTYGYWYPETPHWVFITGIDDDGAFGVHMEPKLNSESFRSFTQWLTEQKYDEIPLLSLLFSPGACFWIYLIGFFCCLYRKSPAVFIYVPIFILWLTALASPVNCEFRYVYGMFLCLPLIAAHTGRIKTA